MTVVTILLLLSVLFMMLLHRRSPFAFMIAACCKNEVFMISASQPAGETTLFVRPFVICAADA